MSKLDELIKELCPDGVEYKRLGEIGTSFYRGIGIKRDEVTTDGIPCVRYGEIYTTYHIAFSHCISHTRIQDLSKGKFFSHGDILFAITGESVEDIAKSCAYLGNENCLAGGDILVMKHEQYPKYIAYALETTEARRQKSKGKIKSKVVHASVQSIKDIIIPVPPLEVQREIVKILDNFTELTADLTDKLSEELTVRKKQYEYYRNQLLTFDTKSHIKKVKLGDVAKVTKLAGFEFTKYVTYAEKGHIIALRGLNVKNGNLDLNDVKYIDGSDLSKLERSKLHVGDMLFTYVGTIGQVALIDKEDTYYLAPNVALIRADKNVLLPEYMRFYFQSSLFWDTQIKRLLQSSSMKNIPMEKIRKFELFVPPIDVQRRLVHVLDNFDKVCNDLHIGLPAEIEARKKQYEFYRDSLLTFLEKGESILTDRQTDRTKVRSD